MDDFKGLYIKKGGGSRYAIGDIHGCFETFRILLEYKIRPSKGDQFFLLGDYIDRGPSSRKVIDYIIHLMESPLEVYALQGNHEFSFLQARQCGEEFFTQYLLANHSQDFFYGDLEKYVHFFKSLPNYFYTEGHYLSHSGFQFLPDNQAKDLLSIHGHADTTLSDIRKAIQEHKPRISIDSGCVYKEVPGLGYLTALNLDSYELICQVNID